MDMKRFFLYAIVIAALALAGCGGNGGGSDMTGGGGTPPPATPPTCLEDPMDANCTGLSQAEIDAATEAAETKTTAIAAEAGQGDDAGLGGGATPYRLTIARDRAGTTVTISDSSLAGAMDPQFMQDMDLGGGTTMHTRTMAADTAGNVEEEVVMVTTDIEAPTGRPFALFEAADGTTPQALDARDLDDTTDADNDGELANDYTALTVVGNTDAARALVKSDAFVPGAGSGNTVLNFDFDNTATSNMDEADEVMGYYNGAMGTYRCNGTAACTVTIDDEGMITALSTGWVFTPAMGATSDQPDYDYLSYGFWLKKTTDADGVLTYDEVETFADSSIDASGAVSTVTGTATYSGGATGVYVKNVFASAGTLDTATSGYFRADASLTATFGQVEVDSKGTIAENMLWTLTGTISDYQLSGGEANNWMTVLDGDITEGTGIASGTAKGGSPLSDGSFSATFHGTVNATTQPSAVVGEFNSSFTDGSVAGGFGARIDQ